MLTAKKYLYVGYFCHLIIEKVIKAYYWYSVHQEPPFTHNLILLANRSGLISLLDEEQKKVLNTLMPLNIEARYPSDKRMLLQQLTQERTEDIFMKTKELYKWIKSLKES